MNGSSGRQRVSGEELASFPLATPLKPDLVAFDRVGSLVLEQMKSLTAEIELLVEDDKGISKAIKVQAEIVSF